jgi:hypothetical protein
VYDCNSGLSGHEDQRMKRQTTGIRDFGRFILLRATCTYKGTEKWIRFLLLHSMSIICARMGPLNDCDADILCLKETHE